MVALFCLQKTLSIFHYDRHTEKSFLKALWSIMLAQFSFHNNIYIPEQFIETQISFTVFYFFKEWKKQNEDVSYYMLQK